MLIEEGPDVGAQCGDAAIDSTPDLALCDEGEEAFDLIEPGGAGRGEVDMPARPFGEPVADQRRLVGGVVVDDEMDVEIAGTLASISSRNLRNSVARWRA